MLTKLLITLSVISTSMYAVTHTLDVLCQKGVENNPKIRSFKHRTAASHSVYDQTFDRYKPSVQLSGRVGEQAYDFNSGSSFSGNTYNYRATVNQVLYRASLGYAMDDADRRIAFSNLQEDDEIAKLITQILQSTFTLVKLEQTMKLYEKKEKILNKAYQNIEKSHALKLASKVDTYQSLARLQDSRSELARVKHIYRQTLFNLRLLTKQTEVKPYIKTIKFDIDSIERTYKDLNLAAVKSQYHQSTRLKLDKQIAVIAKGQVDLRGSERYPSVSLALSAGDAGGTLDNFTRQNETSAIVSIDFPIYQGGYVSDRKEEAYLLYLAALDEAENTEITIKISLEKALQDIASGLESAKAERVAVKATKNYLEATMKSYKNGLGSLTDVYLAEADYHDSEVRLIATKASIFVAVAEVYYFSGNANIEQVKRLTKKHLN